MSNDFYTNSIQPFSAIIIKICRAYSNTQEDFEDYYQEVCLQIWRTRNNFQGQADWSTWVYRLALNVCLTLLRKKKNDKEHFSSEFLPRDLTENSQAFADEHLNHLYNAIKLLSEVDRGVILLYLEERSNKEIAAITGTNPNNIGVRINRIKERLRKLLDGKIY